jgi:uncharacterized Ntn-hydrolase superfamily protein
MTFSIIARLGEPALFGVAIASSSPAVAARCAHARAGTGAVATQNITDPSLGPRLLDSLARGLRSDRALEEALLATPFGAYRQLLVIGRDGLPAVHSGEHALGTVACALGARTAAAGNLLASARVPAAMLEAFDETAALPDGAAGLADRLVAALRAGLDAGGEAGPVHSAGLLVVRDLSWPLIDLRVDWSESDPLAVLAWIWALYAPQMEAYVQRALDPQQAPSFGVPGDPSSALEPA